jgi:uncharacterized membrane protein
MEEFLRGMLRDLERRSAVLRDRLAAAPDDPDLRDHALAGYREAESLRREAAALLADPSLGAPALLTNHLRVAQELERRASLIESYLVPFVERYGEADRRLTRLCRHLAAQVRWPTPPPLVVAFSSQYYWTVAPYNVIAAPAAEGTSLLRLPDLCHELGHILQVDHQAALVGDFIQELASYIDQERQRTVRQQRPPQYLPLYDPLFAEWRDAWLVEFVADMVAAYLVGPAFGWQHVRLCAGEGQAVYYPALGEVATHPADEARLRGVLAVLARMGSAAGPRIQALWGRYLAVNGEVRPADYEVCYPDALLDSLAWHVVEGCREIGLRSWHEAANSNVDIVSVIGETWERFLRDADDYPGWEQDRMKDLWTALGLGEM